MTEGESQPLTIYTSNSCRLNEASFPNRKHLINSTAGLLFTREKKRKRKGKNMKRENLSMRTWVGFLSFSINSKKCIPREKKSCRKKIKGKTQLTI